MDGGDGTFGASHLVLKAVDFLKKHVLNQSRDKCIDFLKGKLTLEDIDAALVPSSPYFLTLTQFCFCKVLAVMAPIIPTVAIQAGVVSPQRRDPVIDLKTDIIRIVGLDTWNRAMKECRSAEKGNNPRHVQFVLQKLLDASTWAQVKGTIQRHTDLQRTNQRSQGEQISPTRVPVNQSFCPVPVSVNQSFCPVPVDYSPLPVRPKKPKKVVVKRQDGVTAITNLVAMGEMRVNDRNIRITPHYPYPFRAL